MIKNEMNGMCKDCKCAELYLESLEVTGGVTWIIGCEHQYACKAMREKATGEVGKNENN